MSAKLIDHTEFGAKLQRFIHSTAHEARLLLQSGPVYWMLLKGEHHHGLRVETVASHRLPPEHKLSAERAKEMRRLGFSKKSGQYNWYKEIPQNQTRLLDLAQEADDILTRLYGCDQQAEILLVEDPLKHPTNPDLLETIRGAAKTKDESHRHVLYNALVNTHFLMPLLPDRADSQDSQVDDFFVFETIDDRAVYGAFSDWQALRLWQPHGWSYRTVHGTELFELLSNSNAIAFRINPGGQVGGQLYRHEIDTLSDAIKEHRSRHAN